MKLKYALTLMVALLVGGAFYANANTTTIGVTAQANNTALTGLALMKQYIINKTFEGTDIDGGYSHRNFWNEEDYDAPLNQDGTRPKAIIGWGGDDWHGFFARGYPVRLRIDPDMDTVVREGRFVYFEANWNITCLNCAPGEVPNSDIFIRAEYKYNVVTGRLDEELLYNLVTGAEITRRPIKLRNTAAGK